jgi:uncharacterized integral membrane protein (TIGR00698 family)
LQATTPSAGLADAGEPTKPAPPEPAKASPLPAQAIWPGLALTVAIAATAILLRDATGLNGLSPLIISLSIGGVIGNVAGRLDWAKAGVQFSLRRLLRLGIVLLGLQLTLGQVAAIGWSGLLMIVGCLMGSFVATTWLGAWLGVDRKLTQLIAAGTAVCGASAILATNTVSRADDSDVAYAVACVTLLGSVAIFVYPLAGAALALPSHTYGLWAGASIHEIAQVVGATYQAREGASEWAMISKLARVAMLAPLVMVLAAFARRGGSSLHAKVPVPWFLLFFVAMMLLSSTGWVTEAVKGMASQAATALLCAALAAMGLEIRVGAVLAKGWKPFLLATMASLVISVGSLAWLLVLK